MSIATLAIIEDLTDRQRGEISIELFCSEEGVDVGISEEYDQNEDLVDRLVENIPPWEHTKRKNAIINHLAKLGFRMITASSTPIFINSKGEITQVRSEVHFETPAPNNKEDSL